MPRIRSPFVAGALLLACAVAFAPAAHASKLGKPAMYCITAKIAPPYKPDFVLNTAVSTWPQLLSPVRATELDAGPPGILDLQFTPDAFDTLINYASAKATTAGVYGTSALMEDLLIQDYVGLFAYSQIVQSFVKDSTGAYLTFHIGQSFRPALYARAFALDDVRSEFALDVSASRGATSLYTFHEAAGVRAWATSLGVTTLLQSVIGPETYTTSHPTPNNKDVLLDFDPYTGSIDLSALNVRDTFTVFFKCMSQVAWIPAESPRGFAQIVDPLDQGGITIEAGGLIPLDNVPTQNLAVAPHAAASLAALSPARPNPAPGAVTFTLDLPAASDVTVDVLDLSGRRVTELARGAFGAGAHGFTWAATDADGRAAPAGVYFVRASGPGFTRVQRVVRLGVN